MSEKIAIASIDASGRLRPVDPDHVSLLAASIEERGLEQPIVVRPAGEGFRLTLGAHRLAAVGSLGWSELTIGDHVLVREEDELEARISEIDENLARHELNALDRALFMAERKKLYEERRKTRGKGGDRKSEKFKAQTLRNEFSDRFSAEAADRIGFSERTIQLALRIAERLDPASIAAIRGTKVERNQQELLALADLEGDEQLNAARLIQTGEAKTVQQARVAADPSLKTDDDPQGRLMAEIKARLPKCDVATLQTLADEVKRELSRKRKEAKP